MPNFRFPGSPAYVQAAAAQLGRPGLAESARRIPALARMADLCAQAAESDPAHIGEILRAAADFRDQIRVARLAADRMLAEARAAAGLAADPGPVPLASPPAARPEGRS